MPKRLTDTDKWKDDWYVSLSNDYRIIWQWLLDNCDHAGICKRSIKILNMMCNVEITESDLVEKMEGRLLISKNLWFIPNFLKFQYSTLLSKKPAIISVREQLFKHGLETMIPQSFGNDYVIVKDTDTCILEEINNSNSVSDFKNSKNLEEKKEEKKEENSQKFREAKAHEKSVTEIAKNENQKIEKMIIQKMLKIWLEKFPDYLYFENTDETALLEIAYLIAKIKKIPKHEVIGAGEDEVFGVWEKVVEFLQTKNENPFFKKLTIYGISVPKNFQSILTEMSAPKIENQTPKNPNQEKSGYDSGASDENYFKDMITRRRVRE